MTPLHIQQYVNFKLESVSPNTVRKHLVNLSKCLDSAVKQNIIAVNPVKRIELPQKVRYMGAKYYNKDQINELLEKSKGDPLETVILPTLFYGLRRSETLGLKWDSVDFLNKTVTIKHTVVKGSHEIYKTEATKNNSSYRTLPMSDIVFKALKRLKK